MQLLDELSSYWRDIGLAIGLSNRKLDSTIKSNHIGDENDWSQVHDVLQLWMAGSLPSDYLWRKFPPKWKTLIDFLKKINLKRDAETLR